MTGSPLTFNLPEVPSGAAIAQTAGALRTVLAGLMGMGVLGGAWSFSDSQLTSIASMVLTVLSFAAWIGVGVWSWWQKRKADKMNIATSKASAIASAQASAAEGTPVPIVITKVADPASVTLVTPTSVHGIVAALLLSWSLAACGATSMVATAVMTSQADPAVIAKINYVCAYSGAFKFIDSSAASVIPVPGVALGVNLVNNGVDKICLHPEAVARGIGVVENLIGLFKSEGKM